MLSAAGVPGDAFGDRLAAGGLAAGLLDDGQVLEASRRLDSFHTSVVTPCGFDHHGLPVGMQIIDRPFAEASLFRVGAAFQEVTDFHRRAPAL